MDTVGYIYILTNDSMPGLVKIGYADDVEQRIKQLSRSTSVAKPFKVYATCEVKSRLADLILHASIDRLNPTLRVSNNKEFFTMSAEQAYNFLDAICELAEAMTGIAPVLVKGTNTIAPSKATKPQQRSHKSKHQHGHEHPSAHFTFAKAGIPAGAEIVYKPDPSVVCTVHEDQKHIVYEGEVYSLSHLDRRLNGYGENGLNRRGTEYFTYNGKTLKAIKDEYDNK